MTSSKNIREAVFLHLKAIRLLGRERVNVTQVCDALGLPLQIVERAIKTMEHLGVKRVK